MTPPVDPSLAIAGGPDTHVAALLPATAAPPEPARKINFFKALLLYWLFPKRYGPHLAVGTWKRAILAHVLSVLVFLAACLPAFSREIRAFNLHDLREDAARMVVIMAAQTTRGSIEWIPVLLTLLCVPLAELAMVLLAILIMPWYAGGDRAGSVFKRSLKSVYWFTTILIPTTAVVLLVAIYQPDPGRWLDQHNDLLTAGVLLLGTGLPIVLLMRMLLAGGTRYVGAAEGPAFAPREPRCDDCGYLIVGLPLETRCPECGLKVRESLPGGRRRPTVWQENEFRLTGFADLLRLQRVVFAQRDFFKRLAVQSGHASARHFWWGTWCLMILATLVVMKLVSFLSPDPDEMIPFVASVAIGVLALPLGLQALMMFAACLQGQLHYGIRDYRISATACYYASPLLWPVIGLLILALLPSSLSIGIWFDSLTVPAPLDRYFTALGLYELIILFAFIGTLLFWRLRLGRALRDIQYANV